jgi:DNA-binding CsgD family transcriptional regulator
MLQGELIVSIKRAYGRGAYSDTELQSLNDALPWLRSMSRTACISWESNFAGQLSAFERLGRGAVSLDERARVVRTNSCVRFGDGIDVVDGRLTAPRPSDQAALNKFLSDLVVPLGELPSTPPATLRLPRTSGGRSWLLDGITCTDAVRSLHSRGAALVLITDLERSACSPTNEPLRRIFSLTPTEAGLASRLAKGRSLQEASRELSISEGHARQRLKTIFQKTGTSRQGELIALLLRFT